MTLATDKIASATQAFYNKVAAKYDNTIARDLSDTNWLDRFLLEVRAKGEVLDVGCGPGNFARFMIDRGRRVLGIDISEEMIAIAGRNVPKGTFLQCDFRGMPFEPNRFDGILIAYSLLHLPKSDGMRTLVACRDALKKGGVLALMMKSGVGELWNKSKLSKGDTYYVQFWTMSELCRAFNKLDLTIIDADIGAPATKLEIQSKKLFLLGKKECRHC